MEDNKPEVRKTPSYEIVERIGTLRENHQGHARVELNRIKWEGRRPVYDLRLWVKEEDGTFRPTSNGLKLYYEDVLILSKILTDL